MQNMIELKNIIELNNVHKSFKDEIVLGDISLDIKENEFLTILGPSGCGKTTLLRIIGGFETTTSGSVLFDGIDLLKLPAHKRNINTVFQSYALFPHLNVEENVAFGLKVKKTDKKTIKEKVIKLLNLVNLSGFEKRTVKSLSGGQQQRVAIARALINEPKVLLLDEPLGALDLKLRKEMQIELKNMQKSLGITFVYVTHDQEEALTMSDTIVVMNKGQILQKGTPEEIYNEPTTAFVANFIGTSNVIPAVMEQNQKVNFLDTNFDCVDNKPESNNISVVIRPEDIKITDENEGQKSQIKAIVTDVVFFGVHYEMLAKVNETVLKIHSTKQSQINETINLYIAPDAIHVIDDSSVKTGGS